MSVNKTDASTRSASRAASHEAICSSVHANVCAYSLEGPSAAGW